jgi:NADPH-dependent 7-cyano-7-deazaguanine reductase QueF
MKIQSLQVRRFTRQICEANMDNCEILEIIGNTIRCICLITGQPFEIVLA